MSPLRWTWLVMSLLGTAVPLGFFIAHFMQQGWGLAGLFRTWVAAPGVSGLTWDLVISATALIIWICAEVAARRNWEALWAIPATLCIGVSCGLPLYLFLRTRPVT